MIDEDDEALIMDFGIAGRPYRTTVRVRSHGSPIQRAELSASPPCSRDATGGAVIGTVDFMAPEQAEGQPSISARISTRWV